MTHALRQELEAVAIGFAAEIEAIVRRRIMGDVTGEPVNPLAPVVALPTATRMATINRTCREAGCSSPSRGPRYGNRCAEHSATWAAGRTVAGKRKRRAKK